MSERVKPSVYTSSGPMAFSQEVLDDCGVIPGQWVSDDTVFDLLNACIAHLDALISIEEARLHDDT